MFKGKRDDSLALLRHAHWEKALVSANKDIDPATLPPIERATIHCMSTSNCKEPSCSQLIQDCSPLNGDGKG